MTRPWFHDAAYVAGLTMLAAGVAGLILGKGWEAVVFAGIGAFVLCVLRGLEHHAEAREALAQRGQVAGLALALERLEKAHEETRKNADAALHAARSKATKAPGY